MKYPVNSFQPSDLNDALRVLIKLIICVYLAIVGGLALLTGIVIIAMTIAFLLLRLIIRVLAMLFHKHGGFSLRDTLFFLLRETNQYYAQGR